VPLSSRDGLGAQSPVDGASNIAKSSPSAASEIDPSTPKVAREWSRAEDEYGPTSPAGGKHTTLLDASRGNRG